MRHYQCDGALGMGWLFAFQVAMLGGLMGLVGMLAF